MDGVDNLAVQKVCLEFAGRLCVYGGVRKRKKSMYLCVCVCDV